MSDRNTKTRLNKQMQAQHTSSPLVCDGCVVPPAGKKLTGEKPTTIDTAAESHGRECSRVVNRPSILNLAVTDKSVRGVDQGKHTRENVAFKHCSFSV